MPQQKDRGDHYFKALFYFSPTLKTCEIIYLTI